jgi:formamidopyrimidine-DNA glycosylase
MPELPEVETYKRYLAATALHKRIDSVYCEAPDMLAGVSLRRLKGALGGRRFEETRRHGKYLFAALDQGPWLVLHFGMTDRLEYFKDEGKLPRHTRLHIAFTNGYRLAYIAQRKLGHIALTGDVHAFIVGHELGPDALDTDLNGFREQASGYRGTVKGWLMDQSAFAGIGNVYSDEILFQARMHPKK